MYLLIFDYLDDSRTSEVRLSIAAGHPCSDYTAIGFHESRVVFGTREGDLYMWNIEEQYR